MKPDLSVILRALSAMRRQERRVLAGKAALLLLAALILAWSGAMALAAWGYGRVTALQVLGGALGLTGLGLLVWAGQRWWRAADELRQARGIEAAKPELRGRLITALERREGPVGQESPGILALIVKRAERMLQGFDPAQVYPAKALRRPALATLALALLWAIGSLLAPMGPVETLRWLGGEARAVGVAPPRAELGTSEVEALVGDIVLRYEYPAYTGLPVSIVENSNGTAHGPPGTRVTVQARTAEVFDEVSLQAYELPPERAELSEGRSLTGAFTIEGEGTWRLLMRRGVFEARSKDFAIALEPDLPPVVEVDVESDRMEVAYDQPIPLRWRVRDDFGVLKVGVRLDGKDGPVLREPLDAPTLLPGQLSRTPDQLGLKPGDEVTLRITGWDNDEVSGSKAGESRPVRIVVLGPKAMSLRFLRLRRELRDALVDVLAGFALDPAPLPERQGELASWASKAATRFEPIEALVDEYWDQFDERSLEGRVVEELRRQANGLLRFVEAVAEPRSEELVNLTDGETVAELHAELVGNLETNILMLDLMVRYQAIAELRSQASLLREAGIGLRMSAEAGASAEALNTRLDRVDMLNERLAKAAADYDGGSLSELVVSWSEDIGRASARSRDLLAEGETERARALAVDLSRTIERLLLTLEAMQREMEEATEEDQQAIQEFIEELQRIEAAERALLAETQAAREGDGGDTQALVSAWERAEAMAGSMAKDAAAVFARLEAEEDKRLPRELSDARRLTRQIERLERAVDARDLTTALEENSFSMFSARQVEDVLRYASGRHALDGGGPDNKANITALRNVVNQSRELEAVLRSIDVELNTASPGLVAQAGAFTEQQEGLNEDLAATLPTARQLAGQLPMGAPGLVESLEGADREMSRATGALARARAVEAEGAEEAAADRVRQALEALAQAAAAMEALDQSMQGGGQPGHGGEGGGGRNNDQGPLSNDRIELPDPEEFRTDEEYREALLRGMQAEVPPEFEALKRRYYEELVRQ
ncbi:MAG: DUF4175 family protein [Alphaproteobacteria bacterium]|nr:DUF4175 family protein [Alphaproteobacteria bacterium]